LFSPELKNLQKNTVAHSLSLQPREGALHSPTSTTTDYYKPYTIQKNQGLNDCNLQKRSNDEPKTKTYRLHIGGSGMVKERKKRTS
jgi:hypothetical protein